MKRRKKKTSIPEIETTNNKGKKFKIIDKEPHDLDYYGIHLRRTKKW